VEAQCSPDSIHWLIKSLWAADNAFKGHIQHMFQTSSLTGCPIIVILCWSTPCPCPRKKPSHFNFWHNFHTCRDIFTIFGAYCSGL